MSTYNTIAAIETARQLLSPPGDTLSETMEEMGISQSELAIRMGRPLKTINEIVHGKARIMPETALQLEKVLAIPATFWIEREKNYQLALARLDEAEQQLQDMEQVRLFPMAAMRKYGWIAASKTTGVAKVQEMCAFFGVASMQAFDNHYIGPQAPTYFRISEKNTHSQYAIAAWLRQGERQADALTPPPYQEKALRETLPLLKAIMVAAPSDWFAQVQSLCLAAGLVVIHTPQLPKAPISGAARWVRSKPVVQLSGRYQRYDSDWFTLFHEIGHILLHGKKDYFIEMETDTDTSSYADVTLQQKEQEANQFAQIWTLTAEQEAQVSAWGTFLTMPQLLAFAADFGTHPAVIVGRLKRTGVLPHTAFRTIAPPAIADALLAH